MNGTGRAFRHTFLAKPALCEIHVCQVVRHCDGILDTDLGTLAAAYAGGGTSLAGYGSLVLVDTGHEHPHAAWPLVAKFDDILGTGPYTGTAGGAFLLIDDGKTGLGVHRNGAELAGRDTIAATDTTERTAGIPAVESGLDPA